MVTLKYQERFKTDKGVFDEFTKRTLFELQSKGMFDEVNIPLKVGKESNVFVAKHEGKNIIIKIYRMQNCDFLRMFGYIKQDPRYNFLKQHRRQVIMAWTQREYKNILRAQKSGTRVPAPLAWRNHILVEEFIGDGDIAAPPLKDCPPQNPNKFFEDLIIQVQKMYAGGLVHGDLSSFNILNHNEKPVIIDFSQSTLTKTPNAQELLIRDIKNITNYFIKLGVKCQTEELLQKIIASAPKKNKE